MSTTLKSPSNSSRLVPVAEIARPHGVAGELRLKLYNEASALFGRGRVLSLQPADGGSPQKHRIARVRETTGALLVTLEGVTDRNQADALRGARVLVPRSDFPELPAGEFYACDVEGARAELENGEPVGVVLRLLDYPTCDVLLIRTPTGAEIEVPLVDGVVDAVDVDAGVVRLVSIEAL